MADLKEVFEMATKQIEPDQDSWKTRNATAPEGAQPQLGAFAAVAVILIAAASSL